MKHEQKLILTITTDDETGQLDANMEFTPDIKSDKEFEALADNQKVMQNLVAMAGSKALNALKDALKSTE